jgi:lysophospholipase L1-like esterase
VTASPFDAEVADPYTLSADSAAAALAGSRWRRLAVLGDSLAKGVGDPSPGYRDLSWADRVADALRAVQPSLQYLNTGERGARVGDVVSGQLPAVLGFRPDLAIVVCGGNDLLAADYSAGATGTLLGVLCRSLRAVGADVLTFTLQDITAAYPSLGSSLRDGIGGLNDVIRSVAGSCDAIVVEMWGHPSQGDQDVYSADMMHASRRGHAIVAAATVRRLALAAGSRDPGGRNIREYEPAASQATGQPWDARDRRG